MADPRSAETRRTADGTYSARVTIVGRTRRWLAMPWCRDESVADARARALTEIARRVRAAGHVEDLPELLRMAARARPDRWESVVLTGVDRLCAGKTTPLSEAGRLTVAEFGRQWRSGELHTKYPDHVPAKKDSTRDDGLARVYVDPVIGDRLIAEVTLDDCDEVMSEIVARHAAEFERRYNGAKPKAPPEPASRRHVAQYLRRLLGLAVYPGRLRTSNPIPKGWLPRVKDAKAKEALYPDEDRALLACVETPLVRRLAYGFLSREGMRTDELAALQWRDVDLERGRIDLDSNKTDDPRAWDLDPGVARALATWKKRFHAEAKPTDNVFAVGGVPLSVERLAEQLRGDLRRAGVTREKLFERSATHRPIRAHDLRATFVTISLAIGHTEAWVADRTGHKSSTMINRYRRKARTWKLGPLDPLDVALPEFTDSCPTASPSAGREGVNSGQVDPENLEESAISAVLREAISFSKSAEATPREGSSPSFGTKCGL
jgi:integrase